MFKAKIPKAFFVSFFFSLSCLQPSNKKHLQAAKIFLTNASFSGVKNDMMSLDTKRSCSIDLLISCKSSLVNSSSFTKVVVPDLLIMEEILHQLIGSLSHYLQDFIYPRWCRISSINNMFTTPVGKIDRKNHTPPQRRHESSLSRKEARFLQKWPLHHSHWALIFYRVLKGGVSKGRG